MPSPPDSHVPRQGSKGSQSPTNSSTDVSDRPANSAPSTNIDTASGADHSQPEMSADRGRGLGRGETAVNTQRWSSAIHLPGPGLGIEGDPINFATYMSPYDFHHGEHTRSGYTHISGMQPYASTPPLNFAAASSPIATQQYLADAGPSTSAANPTQTPPGARPKNVRTSKVKRTIVGRERGPESPKGRKPRHGQGSKDRRNQDDSEPKDPEGGSADDSAAAP